MFIVGCDREELAHTIARRVGRYLERQGLLERDAENDYLALDAADDDPLSVLQGHSITYRIAVGPQAGRKVFTLQTLPACDPADAFGDCVGKVAGFSLHAGVAAKADERKKLERLCRYISRPAVSEKRLSLTPNGTIRYQLKTPYRDGTTHVIFEPLDFIARLAALVPRPRVNLTRFHGVFAPNSQHRALVTPAKRGKGDQPKTSGKPQDQTPAERRTAMTWAQRLKRVFNIDIETCTECGGSVKVIACIEDPRNNRGQTGIYVSASESRNSSLTPIIYRLFTKLNLGLDIRYSQADVTLFNKERETGGLHTGLFVGYHW